ncbi:MAG: response regulator transcription factor [Eubacterium sp.]
MRLLLAEDEKELSNALVAILKHNNYSVDAVYNGEDALNFLETENYDGAILDIMMPKMDGITVLKRIRQQGNDVPILILTAKSDIDDRVLGLDSGADDYLSKPFAAKELLARIRSVTRRKTEAVSSILKFGNISLNCANFELSSPQGAIRLQNKEFQMLEMLIANPKQLISPERFLEKIWGYDSNAEINVVWVYISYLRKKLSALEADIQIKATRNQGYSLEEL